MESIYALGGQGLKDCELYLTVPFHIYILVSPTAGQRSIVKLNTHYFTPRV